jgi:hypothetical protein
MRLRLCRWSIKVLLRHDRTRVRCQSDIAAGTGNPVARLEQALPSDLVTASANPDEAAKTGVTRSDWVAGGGRPITLRSWPSCRSITAPTDARRELVIDRRT